MKIPLTIQHEPKPEPARPEQQHSFQSQLAAAGVELALAQRTAEILALRPNTIDPDDLDDLQQAWLQVLGTPS